MNIKGGVKRKTNSNDFFISNKYVNKVVEVTSKVNTEEVHLW